jgi:hypothetical protein
MSAAKRVAKKANIPKCIVCAAYKRELDKSRAQHQATKARAREVAQRNRARLALEAPQEGEVSIKWLRRRIDQLAEGRKARGGKDIGAEEAAFRELLAIRLARVAEAAE